MVNKYFPFAAKLKWSNAGPDRLSHRRQLKSHRASALLAFSESLRPTLKPGTDFAAIDCAAVTHPGPTAYPARCRNSRSHPNRQRPFK